MSDTFFGMPTHEAQDKLLKYSRHEELMGLSAAMYALLKESTMKGESVDPCTIARIGKSLKDMGVILDD